MTAWLPAPARADVVPAPVRQADSRGDGPVVVTQEEDCYEVVVTRAARLAELQALVPPRYSLVQLTPTIGRLFFIDYACARVAVGGVGTAEPTVTTIVATQVQARDGVPLNALYLLGHTTTSRLLAARYAALGLPTTWSPATTSSSTAVGDGSTSTVVFDVVGGGLDHTLVMQAVEPPVGPVVEEPGGTFVHDGPRGDLELAYANAVRPASSGRVVADFRAATALGQLFVAEQGKLVNGGVFGYFRGDWTGTLSRDTAAPDRPASTTTRVSAVLPLTSSLR